MLDSNIGYMIIIGLLALLVLYVHRSNIHKTKRLIFDAKVLDIITESLSVSLKMLTACTDSQPDGMKKELKKVLGVDLDTIEGIHEYAGKAIISINEVTKSRLDALVKEKSA